MSNQAEEAPDEHLSGLEDGAGCTEIWEKLSETREQSNQIEVDD